MSAFEIVMGWSAPPMKEQFPTLSDDGAEQFDANSAAISRLSIHGLITRVERDRAAKRLTKAVRDALTKDSRR